MQLRHAAKVLIVAALVAACGREQAVVVQPPGCETALERVPGEPAAGDVRVGDAWISRIAAGRRAWRENWQPRKGYAFFRAHLMIPSGGTLTLTVPPEARGLVRLEYGDRGEVTDTATVRACHGVDTVVAVTGGLRVRRPLCRVPLDWRYGNDFGRVELTFGGACDR